MPRRKRPLRTDIPDWRDPNMPVLRRIENELREVPAHINSMLCQRFMDYGDTPNWRDDDTYHRIRKPSLWRHPTILPPKFYGS